MTKSRNQFWSEKVYALKASTIPERLRKSKSEKTKWSVLDIIKEILRDSVNSKHVDAPLPPEHIWGLHPCDLRAREQQLHDAADQIYEQYERRGRVHTRQQKSTTPVLLVAVASWPEPDMLPTPERDRWVGLVIEAAKFRWGKCLKGAYAHSDEGKYHLHLVVDDGGLPVKRLHLGHGYAAEVASRGHARAYQAEAYKLGCIAAQDWYHREVAGPLGWARKSESPRPRLPRAAALRKRQEELEQAEAELMVRDRELARAALAIEDALAKLVSRKALLDAQEAQLEVSLSDLRKTEPVNDRRWVYEEPSVF